MVLTDRAIKLAKSGDRTFRLTDGRGLTLLVQPNGSKWWRYRYRFEGLEKMLSLGVYPDVPLALARERGDAARRAVARGVDPSSERKAERAGTDHTFGAVARQWLVVLNRKVHDRKRSQNTYDKAKWMLESFILPTLGNKLITKIKPHDLLIALKKIEAKGHLETARRTKQRCGQIFRFAVGLVIDVRDITVDLRGLLEAPVVEHHASVTLRTASVTESEQRTTTLVPARETTSDAGLGR